MLEDRAIAPEAVSDEATVKVPVDAPAATLPSAMTGPVIASALLVAACGGGGGTGGTAAAPAPIATATATPTPTASPSAPASPAAPALPSAVQASRLLGQSTMGATRAMVDDVAARGYAAWLDGQFAMSRATSHWDWLVANGYNAAANVNNTTGFDPTMWRQLIAEPDQLRQRVGMALLDLLVVGIDGLTLSWKQFAMAAYVDVLLDNAFGNFRTLMGAITTNPAMASFLTFLGNRKANAATGAVPDENYARELMQLFTIGLYQLDMDGSLKGGGTPIETYTLADVTGLARVFTGLNLTSSDNTTPDRYRVPLAITASQNETGAASFLGTTVSGGGMAAVNAALDAIFNHANVPPFVSKQLIQRLVTSNPSPGYVGRISAVFANNGSGVRGDLKAVVRAILLDSEARDDAMLGVSTTGRLREPVMRLTGWARAFGATSASNAWAIGDTSSQSTRLGQSMGRSQTVFKFFRPGYIPPATAIASAGLVAPEFQITNEQSVVGYVNYMYALVSATGDFKADYTAIMTKSADSAALVDEINVVLAGGQLSTPTVSAIRAAVDSVAPNQVNTQINRVGVAVLLTLASPDYLTVR